MMEISEHVDALEKSPYWKIVRRHCFWENLLSAAAGLILFASFDSWRYILPMNIICHPHGGYDFFNYLSKKSAPFSADYIHKIIFYGDPSNPHKIVIQYKYLAHAPVRLYRAYLPEAALQHFTNYIATTFPEKISHRTSFFFHRAMIMEEVKMQVVALLLFLFMAIGITWELMR